MKVAIAGDHYTVELVDKIITWLTAHDIVVQNLGTTSAAKKISLLEIIPAVANKVKNNEVDFGVLACGAGVGVEIGANRFKGVRATLCRDPEQAKNARIYDNANLLCFGSWYADDFEYIVKAWLENTFDGDSNRSKMLQGLDELTEHLPL